LNPGTGRFVPIIYTMSDSTCRVQDVAEPDLISTRLHGIESLNPQRDFWRLALAHRARAPRRANSLLSSRVIDAMRDLPPFLPPFVPPLRPISRITLEIAFRSTDLS